MRTRKSAIGQSPKDHNVLMLSLETHYAAPFIRSIPLSTLITEILFPRTLVARQATAAKLIPREGKIGVGKKIKRSKLYRATHHRGARKD